MRRRRKVLWLPAHPSAGATSMDRYWRELQRVNDDASKPDSKLQITSPLGRPPTHSQRAARLVRFWHKYVAYPCKVRFTAGASDLVHLLDHSFAPLLRQIRQPGVIKVATVHDLAPLHSSSELTVAQSARFRKSVEALHLADLLLVDSQHTARELVELLKVPAEKIRVLPLGVDAQRFSAPVTDVPLPWRERLRGRCVILSIGTAVARKNLRVLPEVCRKAKRALDEHGLKLTLLRVGSPLPTELAGSLDQILGQDGFVELGNLPDAEVIAAYQRADILFFPSTLEGFGFPVLEAMAAGCPVVCSDATSLPEVGGEAALYFSLDAIDAAAESLIGLLCDAKQRQACIDQGRLHVRRFSWELHFAKLQEIYEELLAGTPQP